VFDKIQTVQPGTIVDNKRLSAVLEQVEAQQAAYPARQQRGHAARQRPPNNLDARPEAANRMAGSSSPLPPPVRSGSDCTSKGLLGRAGQCGSSAAR